jgi:hypothetical protein
LLAFRRGWREVASGAGAQGLPGQAELRLGCPEVFRRNRGRGFGDHRGESGPRFNSRRHSICRLQESRLARSRGRKRGRYRDTGRFEIPRCLRPSRRTNPLYA